MDTPRLQIKFKKNKKNMKTRNNIEILEIMVNKRNLDLFFETGLCYYLKKLYDSYLINADEYLKMEKLLIKELFNKEYKDYPYVWKKHYVVPRYRFLKELIIKLNELENKNK